VQVYTCLSCHLSVISVIYLTSLYGCTLSVCVQALPGFLLVFSAKSGRILYVSNNVSNELGHPAVSDASVRTSLHPTSQTHEEYGMRKKTKLSKQQKYCPALQHCQSLWSLFKVKFRLLNGFAQCFFLIILI